MDDPVHGSFIGLIGVSTMQIALAALPYSRGTATILFTSGTLFAFSFTLWRSGRFWHGGHDPSTITPVLYLPAVPGLFVTSITASALGFPDWGQLAFGAGIFSWLAIESVLLNRVYTAPELPVPLRPTLGIQLAPPTVGAVAYLSAAHGTPDFIAHALLGYGLLQALLLIRLLPWIWQQTFALSYWTFSLGATALATAPLRMMEHGDTGAVAYLAAPCFVAANVVVTVLTLGTLKLALQRRLLPRRAASLTTPVPTQAR